MRLTADGRNFRIRRITFDMLLPAITNVTAVRMSISPMLSRVVNDSPNAKMPMRMPVSGSMAPNMAVGVEPMLCTATVVQRKETTVGRNASAMPHPHISGVVGRWNVPLKRMSATKTEVPLRMT